MDFNQKIKIYLIIITVLIGIIYWPTFVWMKARFLEVESYYSHGFLVPFVFLFLIWRQRDMLKTVSLSSQNVGLVLLICSLLIHIIAFRWAINFLSGFSLILSLAGLVLYLFGKRLTYKIFFPICFLIFMVPLPQVLIITISFKMKIFAAQVATAIINIIGVPAIRAGSIVYLPNTLLTIGSPCSGLRSLISLTALGSVFAYLVNLSVTKKISLFLMSIPLALLSNIIRIVLLLLVAFVYGADVATGKFHDFSGFLVFIFTLVGLIIVGRLLAWGREK